MHHFSRFMGLRVWRTGRHSLTNKSVSHSENWIYGSLSCCSTADGLKWRFQYLRLYFHCVKYRRRFTSCFVDCKTDCVKRVICMQTDGQVSCLIAFVTARRCLLPDARSLKLVGFHRRSQSPCCPPHPRCQLACQGCPPRARSGIGLHRCDRICSRLEDESMTSQPINQGGQSAGASRSYNSKQWSVFCAFAHCTKLS